MPALLAIWDIGADRVTGAWLQARGVDPGLLTELGFLVPAGWEGDDLIDDEDEVGPVAAEAVVRVEKGDAEEGDGKVADLKVTEGQMTPAGNPDRYGGRRDARRHASRALRHPDAFRRLAVGDGVAPRIGSESHRSTALPPVAEK